MCVCVYACMCTCVEPVCVCVCMCTVCVYVCVYVCVCARVSANLDFTPQSINYPQPRTDQLVGQLHPPTSRKSATVEIQRKFTPGPSQDLVKLHCMMQRKPILQHTALRGAKEFNLQHAAPIMVRLIGIYTETAALSLMGRTLTPKCSTTTN